MTNWGFSRLVALRKTPNRIGGGDSYDPATQIVPGEKITLYEYIVKKEGRRPAFFGRYITHFDKPAVLTDAEAKFLLDLDCKILPFHVDKMWFGAVKKAGAAGVASGKAAAQSALAAASKLSIPTTVYIYANIEPHWNPTADWMMGWWKVFGDSPYDGSGFYCGPSAFAPYERAVEWAKDLMDEKTRKKQPVLWFTKPSGNPSSAAMPRPENNPFAVKGWQYSFHHGKANFEYDFNVATDDAVKRMWSR